jgi:D-alanyl-D-alanine carboxypeptidase
LPRDPHDLHYSQMTEEEQRRRAAARVKRRKKRRLQRLLLLGAFALAAILLVVAAIAILRAIFGGGKQASSSAPSSSASASVFEPVTPPSAGPGVSWTVAPDPSVWNLVLVNNQYPLPDGFALADDQQAGITYTKNGVGVTYRFDARIIDELNAMIAECNAVSGHSLEVISGMRGNTTQSQRYEYLVTYFKGEGHSDAEAEMLARQQDPPAGYSEHQTGLAVDFVTGTIAEPGLAFAETGEFAWLNDNAARFGFVLRYPSEKEAITGIRVQPYHWRYVGAQAAATMKAEGRCLEEYLAKMPDAGDSASASGDALEDGNDG